MEYAAVGVSEQIFQEALARDYFHLRNTYVPYTFLFSFFMSFFGMYQIRFGEHRKTNSNRIWYNVCTIFGWKVYHIRSEYGTNVPYSADYGTFVPYTFLYQILSDIAPYVFGSIIRICSSAPLMTWSWIHDESWPYTGTVLMILWCITEHDMPRHWYMKLPRPPPLLGHDVINVASDAPLKWCDHWPMMYQDLI